VTPTHVLSGGSGWGSPEESAEPPTTLLMLRHGETVLTPEKRFSGSGGTEPGLSGVGRWPADRAAGATHLAGAGT